MKYRIIEIEKSGFFQIEQEVEERKLTIRGFKTRKAWTRMHIDFLWGGKWIINLWRDIDSAKEWLKEYHNWQERDPLCFNLEIPQQ